MRNRFGLGMVVGAPLAALVVIGASELFQPAEAATPSSAVERFRAKVYVLNVALRDVTQARQDLIDQGGASFIADILDGDPDPDPNLSSADMVAAAAAIAAVNQTLDDNSKEHRKALLKAES